MEDTPHDVGCMLPVFGSAKDVSTQIYQEEGGPEGARFAFIFRGRIVLRVLYFRHVFGVDAVVVVGSSCCILGIDDIEDRGH